MDTISFGPDREPRRWLPRPRWPGWRGRPARLSRRAWLAIVAVAAGVVVVASLAFVASRSSGRRPAGRMAAAAMPLVLSGVAAGPAGTNLIIGGDDLWRVGAGRPRVVLGGLLSSGLSPLLPGADGTARISQILPVAGGEIALMKDTSSAATDSNAGPVLFIPAGAGRVRLIARASAIAVAPGGRSVWVQTALRPPPGAPAATAEPVFSPTFAVSLAGRPLSPVLRLPLTLVAATSSGLLTGSDVGGQFRLWNSVTGRPRGVRQPGGARVVGAGSGLVIWLSSSCAVRCPLRVSDLRAGGGSTVSTPAGWRPPEYQVPVAVDASGQRFAIPLVRIDSTGNPTAEDLYVIDPAVRSVQQVPGGPSASGQPLGLSGPGLELTGAWDQRGRLWVLATSAGGYFQLGYWTGAGPLHVYAPERGNPVAISAPGTG